MGKKKKSQKSIREVFKPLTNDVIVRAVDCEKLMEYANTLTAMIHAFIINTRGLKFT